MKKRQKNLIITEVLVGILLTIYEVFALLPRNKNFLLENPMMKVEDTPLLIAHGGGNKEFPDNTLEAFYNAYSVDENMMLETDVSLTKDGVLILSHDISLDRKTDVTGYISDWNYSDLIEQKVNFGYTNPVEEDENGVNKIAGDRVIFTNDEGIEVKPSDVSYPSSVELDSKGGIMGRDSSIYLATTLEDLLVNFPNSLINIEIKQDGEIGLKAMDEALRLLEEYDAFSRCVLASFHDDIFNEFKEYKKSGEYKDEFMYSPSTGGVIKYYILQFTKLDYFYYDDIAVFQLPMEQKGITLSTKSLVNNAHRHNIAVHFWTIDEEEDMEYLISIGADGIMTNYPHKLKKVYDEYVF